MNIKNNEKYQKTEMIIKNAFLELLDIKDISQITIKEICDACHISRTTFYVHYEDIYALSHAFEKEMGTKIAAYFVDLETKEVVLTRKSLYEMFDYIKENQKVFSFLFSYSNSLCEILRVSLLEVIEEHKVDKVVAHYQLNFFFGGLYQILHLWLKEGCFTSIEIVVSNIYKMIPISQAIDYLY